MAVVALLTSFSLVRANPGDFDLNGTLLILEGTDTTIDASVPGTVTLDVDGVTALTLTTAGITFTIGGNVDFGAFDALNIGDTGTDITSSLASFGVNLDLATNDALNIGNTGTDITSTLASFAVDININEAQLAINTVDPTGVQVPTANTFYGIRVDGGSGNVTGDVDAAITVGDNIYLLAKDAGGGAAASFHIYTGSDSGLGEALSIDQTQNINFLNNDLNNIGNAGTDITSSSATFAVNLTAGAGASALSNVSALVGAADLTHDLGNFNTHQIIGYGSGNGAINKGGAIMLGGSKLTASNNGAIFASIAGLKENGTNNNQAGYLAFFTNPNASSVVEAARFTSSGALFLKQDIKLVNDTGQVLWDNAAATQTIGLYVTSGDILNIGGGGSVLPGEIQLVQNTSLNNNNLTNIGDAGNDITSTAVNFAKPLTVAAAFTSDFLRIIVENTSIATGSAAVGVDMKLPASGTARIMLRWIEGSGNGDAGNQAYEHEYNANSSELWLRSQNIDGASTLGYLYEVSDGTNDFRFHGDITPHSDGAQNLGTTALTWADMNSVLINGADIRLENKWTMLELEDFIDYDSGWALTNNIDWRTAEIVGGSKPGEGARVFPEGEKPIFAVTENFIEYQGRRITQEGLDELLALPNEIAELNKRLEKLEALVN